MLSILGNIFIYSPHLFAATILSSQLEVQVSSQGIWLTALLTFKMLNISLIIYWKSFILYPDNAHRLLFYLIIITFFKKISYIKSSVGVRGLTLVESKIK